MAELLASKVAVVEEPPPVRGIPSLSTSVAGAVGVTERGPVGEAVRVTSFPAFVERFGGFTPDSDLALAAMGFFGEGGNQLWVVRTAHYERPLDPQSLTARSARAAIIAGQVPTPAMVEGNARAPFRLTEDTNLQLRLLEGPPRSVRFTGEPGSVRVAAAEPVALADAMTLQLRVDSGAVQTVLFRAEDFENIAAASLSEIEQVLAAQLTGVRVIQGEVGVLVESQTRGRRSRVEVLGGRAAPLLRFLPVREGSGTVADLSAVTGEEVKLLVESEAREVLVSVLPDQTLTLRTRAVGESALLQVVGEVRGPFGFDVDEHRGSDAGDLTLLDVRSRDPGTYGNQLSVSAQPSGDGREPFAFDLRVYERSLLRETWPSLSFEPTSLRYAPSIVNDRVSGSRYIRVTPAPGMRGRSIPGQTQPLLGGDDGLAGLSDIDFLGTAPARSGLRALDRVQDLSILLVPGQATPAVHQGMVQYCEVVRSGTCFPVLDPPERMSGADIVEYVENSAALGGLSEHGAIYWPRVEVLNPDRSVFGSDTRLVVAPSGIIAGVYARTDGARPGGVYDPPAGIEKGRMLTVLGFETDEVLEEPTRDVVYPRRINPLTTAPGFPRYIDGSRTLKGDGSFPFVSERRGVSFIARSLKAGLEFARHRANDSRLRAEVKRTITAFLIQQMNQGAFRSRDPRTAFFVDVSEQLNTPSVIYSGRLLVRVGLATQRPAEWVIVALSQDVRSLEAELAA
jgi:phage tail sheath protein FI